jgi:hypothetical protein
VGIDPASFRMAYEAKNIFYKACIDNIKIRGVGFDDAPEFPLGRQDFPRLITPLPPIEEAEKPRRWYVAIEQLAVTSPNWDRSDKTRLWKGKDSSKKEKLFKIEDEGFWRLVATNKINPHVIDVIRVQWVFDISAPRPKDFRVLRVLEYNGIVLAEALDENALDAILGGYSKNDTDFRQFGLFKDID